MWRGWDKCQGSERGNKTLRLGVTLGIHEPSVKNTICYEWCDELGGNRWYRLRETSEVLGIAIIRGVKNWAGILIYKCNKYCLRNFYDEILFYRISSFFKFKYSCSTVLFGTDYVFFFISFKREAKPYLRWWWWFGSEIVSVRWLRC